jgi:hypothetical protein
MRDAATPPRRSAGLPPRRAAAATRRGQPAGAAVTALALAALALAACAEPAGTGAWSQASTVESHVATGCSTSVVIELSRQIAEEVDCLMPGQLVRFDEGPGLVFAGSAVLPYMSAEARADLLAAAAEGELRLNSAYRSVAQQYLLWRWYQAGRCGITAAATPGRSNHESGRAIDVGNWSERRASLERHGWRQTVPGDEVHFDHLASPDIRGSDVLAFQRLWNRNHPDDAIDEDGFFGPQTEARLAAAPAAGFPVGAICAGDPGPGGDGDPVGPDAGDGDPAGPDALTGGCAAGGGAGGAAGALALLALALGRRSAEKLARGSSI